MLMLMLMFGVDVKQGAIGLAILLASKEMNPCPISVRGGGVEGRELFFRANGEHAVRLADRGLVLVCLFSRPRSDCMPSPRLSVKTALFIAARIS